MGTATEPLRRVIRAFESQGISNPIQIAEGVAFLLLVRGGWDELLQAPDKSAWYGIQQANLRQYYPNLVLPAPPSLLIVNRIGEIIGHLTAAFEAAGHPDIGVFFQRYVRVELLRGATGSQYPTPHHIANFMTSLAIQGDTPSILDPAAGTSGLLVTDNVRQKQAHVTGIDYDPQWAGMGSTNLILNNLEGAKYQLSQALDQFTAVHEGFDAVVMNPPFGGALDAEQVTSTVGRDFGRDRSTVLAGMALSALKPEGIAAFLLPAGALFGGSGAAHLRHVLLNDYRLEAVITLPPDAFQPYSQVAAHLIVARKAAAQNPVWFCSLNSDGYEQKAGRDLTEDPKDEINELPRARDLVLKTRDTEQWVTRFTADNVGDVQATSLGRNGELRGAAVRISQDARHIVWSVLHFGDGVMIKLRDVSGTLVGWLYEPYADTGHALGFDATVTQSVTWTSRIYGAWTDGLPLQWHGDSDASTVEIIHGTSITLKINGAEFPFDRPVDDGVFAASACLFDNQGHASTTWLGIDQEKLDQLRSEISSSDAGSTLVEDATGQQVGWLFELTNDQEEQEQQTILLILQQTTTRLFGEDGSNAYAFLEKGFLDIGVDGDLRIKTGGISVSLREGVNVQGVAIGPSFESDTSEYRLFGVLVPRTSLLDGVHVRDMRPSNYLPEQPQALLGSPTEVLASIRHAQKDFSLRLESLVGMLGEQRDNHSNPNVTAMLSPLVETLLGQSQQALLDVLRAKQNDGIPEHFDLDRMMDWLKSADLNPALSLDELRQQLRVFVRLGVIKEVYFHSSDGSLANGYRLITVGDIKSRTS